MEIKTFEIRDRATFIPAMAVRLGPTSERERYLLARAGYGRDETTQSDYIVLSHLSTCKSNYDIYGWGDRTMQVAHNFIKENWHALESGEVIDVEYILGETIHKKISEEFTAPGY